MHRISCGAQRQFQRAGKRSDAIGNAFESARPGFARHRGSRTGTKLLVREFTSPSHPRRARKGERYPQFSTSDRQEAARFQSTSETRNDILDSRNNPVNGLGVKESSGHVRKISHIRRVAPAMALLPAVALAAWPDGCGQTERKFPSRRATRRHPAAERDDRPVAASRRAREDVRYRSPAERVWTMSREGRGGRTSGATSDLLARGRDRGYLQPFSALLPSSSGPGRRPLTAKTGVRVP